MGLDMYLKEKVYLPRYKGLAETSDLYRAEFELADRVLETVGLKTEVDGAVYVSATVMYWRKSNEIHSWFVENLAAGVDDCRPVYVPTERLTELIETCKEVLADKKLAPELLPTASGFFFGGTDYDEWYFRSLEQTVAGLTRVLENAREDAEFEYEASW